MNLFLKLAEYGIYSFLIVFGIIFTRLFLFQVLIVDGNSMLPGLKPGDVVLIYKKDFPKSTNFTNQLFVLGKVKVKKMDILLFEAPDGSLLLKRVIGLPGDFYSFKNGMVFIDNEPVAENYLVDNFTTPPNIQSFSDKESYYPIGYEGRIPPGYYMLLGDNRKISYDSRSFGLVPEEALRGKVVYQF
jgi:signal peptidase I